MKEEITLRLYEDQGTRAQRHAGRYEPAEEVCGWNYDTGVTIPIEEQEGGHLFAVLDKIDEQVHEDDTGRYRIATAWVQD